ncbi:HNH endonuclease [Halobacillus karajensis]|uniref:HNH nuclease domain-containing protein n=1 Tax=Halobacillus karajensis TaxID=195088 RepID=A0A059NZ51_9BACI|nr:HNH endonuclease [Halobacillus karajensis]CDQ20893.1 hypothetical protein BN982_03248 [Halobacillus karajensis]CDQ23636.1 hypothetical protein BN983_01887 [Halobacillus karajensis]CDQ27114.1 hypothetical protein BN981_01368 [Halobacillus karajensis]
MRSVSDIVQSWGFERIYLSDLPEDYSPYDWQAELTDTTFMIEEKLQALLDEMSIEDGKVYIESQTPFYNQLFILAIRKGTTMNSLLLEWGFKRIYREDLEAPDQPEKSLEALPTDQAKIEILEQLKQIMKIEGSLKRTKIVSEKIERSQTLSKALKKLYDYRCQICGDKEGIPQILKADGTPYVEVHHIIPVSEADHVQDDAQKILDSYHNTVVVCPHHHTYIHFHRGGFEKVVETNEETAFIGKKGDRIPILLNYHITGNPLAKKPQ